MDPNEIQSAFMHALYTNVFPGSSFKTFNMQKVDAWKNEKICNGTYTPLMNIPPEFMEERILPQHRANLFVHSAFLQTDDRYDYGHREKIRSYVTVISSSQTPDYFAVYFGEYFGYLLKKPNETFFNDIRSRSVRGTSDSYK